MWLPAAAPTIHLDAKAERVRATAEPLVHEPIATVVIGRGLPPRKWPPMLAIVVAIMGAALTPVSGTGPFVFWGLAIVTAVLWRQYQEGHLPPSALRPAGALVVTPTRVVLVGVRRGWFDSSNVADEVLASEPLHPLELHNRPGWGHVEVEGRRLYVDDAKRARRIGDLNSLIASIAAGSWQPPHHLPAVPSAHPEPARPAPPAPPMPPAPRADRPPPAPPEPPTIAAAPEQASTTAAPNGPIGTSEGEIAIADAPRPRDRLVPPT